jgi:hypothetical protein
MNRRRRRLIVAAVVVLALCGGIAGAQSFVMSRIAARVEQEIPNASGVSVSIPLRELPGALASDSIKSMEIKIERFLFKGSNTNAELEISASRISKSQPTRVGSLNVAATIPTATILQSANFNDAQIVGNTLQVSAGAGGAGRATLIPKYSSNQIYFELVSVSFLGNDIPASSLTDEVKDEIRNRSKRSLNLPQGLQVRSVSLSDRGLSLEMQGRDVQVNRLAAS